MSISSPCSRCGVFIYHVTQIKHGSSIQFWICWPPSSYERRNNQVCFWKLLLASICILSNITSNVLAIGHVVMTSTFNWIIWNIERHFHLDVYTIVNRNELTIWTICAFRALNPHQWSLAKPSTFKNRKVMLQKCQNKLKPKGMV